MPWKAMPAVHHLPLHMCSRLRLRPDYTGTELRLLQELPDVYKRQRIQLNANVKIHFSGILFLQRPQFLFVCLQNFIHTQLTVTAKALPARWWKPVSYTHLDVYKRQDV